MRRKCCSNGPGLVRTHGPEPAGSGISLSARIEKIGAVHRLGILRDRHTIWRRQCHGLTGRAARSGEASPRKYRRGAARHVSDIAHHRPRKGADRAFPAADLQGRDGAPDVLASIRRPWPWRRPGFAVGGHAEPKLRGALAPRGAWPREVVKRSDPATGFKVLPHRRDVERIFALARPLPETGTGLSAIHRLGRGLDRHLLDPPRRPPLWKVSSWLIASRVGL